jgi:antirestriction protein ArdC
LFKAALEQWRTYAYAAYIDNWLKVLKADKKAIFTAVSQAANSRQTHH